MDIQDLKQSGLIFYETIVGSQAYGTNNADSDVDIKGFYWVPASEYISINPPVKQQDGQISDEKQNNVYYSLYKSFYLLKEANPNFIELLWMPNDCIQLYAPEIMDELLWNRNLFISKQAYFSHSDYALNQIKKARGKNKKVHNPCPENPPVKEDFCRVILLENLMPSYEIEEIQDIPDWFPTEENDFTFRGLYPFRPVPLKDSGIDLSKYHVASLEHAPNAYRLYDYGDKAKGVFRGDNMLVTESIPKQDEWPKISGILLYDKNEYDKALKDWHSYWDWMKFRNSSRWVDQENGLLDYDQKNMAHCVRLMMASESILTIGEPCVRMEGENLDYLMKIRRGELTYDEIMETVSKMEIKLKDIYLKSNLPEVSDVDKLDKLYRHLMDLGTKMFD